MPLSRCPRCLAVDISADAHPTRVLRGDEIVDVFVCRGCYRAAELEFRIACETRGIPYAPLTIHEGLRRLAFFYRERLDAWDALEGLEADERESATRPIRAALDDVERRLRIAPVRDA